MQELQQRISIAGISQSLPPALSPDGESSNLSNLRCDNGVWRPVGNPKLLYTPSDPARKTVYIHVNESYKHYLTYDGTRLYHEATEKNGSISPVQEPVGFELANLQHLESIGNTLIAFTADSICYFLYIEGKYKKLGSHPDFPEISFCVGNSKEQREEWSSYTLAKQLDRKDLSQLSDDDKIGFINSVYGAYHQAKEKLIKAGYISFPILIRYALRLYDDSYIYPSPPVLLALSNALPFNKKIFCDYKISDGFITQFSAGTFPLSGEKVYYIPQKINLSEWSDIIKGVDVFFSRELPVVKEENTLENLSFSDENGISQLVFSLPTFSTEEQKESVLNETLFYKVASIDIETLKSREHRLNAFSYTCSLDNLVHQRLFPLDNFSLHSLRAKESYVYNGRLHLGNITVRYFSGYPPTVFDILQDRYYGTDISSPEIFSAAVQVTLKNATGISHLIARTADSIGCLSPYISYPDSRAVALKIYGYDSSGKLTHYKELPLKASSNENMAYYLQDDLLPIELEPAKISVALPQESHTEEYSPTKLRVSAAYNPFRFPQENTYTISSGTILGMAAATAALSQGQYGEFPLYVFTSDGIWALQQGSGDVVYADQHPVNREVALSPAHIVSIDDAVLYLSEQGLMALQGADVSLLSAPFEGMPDLPLSQEFDDPAPFKTFVKNAVVGYNYTGKELLFLNTDYDYMWVFDLRTLQWSVRTSNYTRFFTLYPALLAIDGASCIYDLCQEENTPQTNIAWVSRAIKVIPDVPKRVRRCMVRAAGSGRLDVSLWASNRAEEGYGCIYRATVEGRMAGRLPMHIVAPAYKSYRLAISGSVSPDTHFDAVDMDYLPVPAKD